MRILAASLLLSVLVATPAFAQDGPVDTAPLTGLKVSGSIAFDRISAGGESSQGFGYGGKVGYDVQFGKLIVGGEGEALFSNAESCTAGVCVEPGRDLYAGARVGVALSDVAMAYVKGGYTNARAKLTTGNTTLDKVDLDGVRGGVGVEAYVNRNVFFGFEYRYSNYESDFSRHQGLVTAGFRF